MRTKFGKAIVQWFRVNRRDLPWRGVRDPYSVWVSEIMLQQTRIETVLGYFPRFMQAFPTVQALAEAPLERVLKLWEGLGYYSRARNLHKGAQEVCKAGVFPKRSEEWKRITGVGGYTASALASLCEGEASPVVDGNVIRVVSRLRAKEDARVPAAVRPELEKWLQPAIEASGAPGDFNEGMMELGETICLPKNPKCERCPIREFCKGAEIGTPERFPGKRVRKEMPERWFAAFVIRKHDGTGRVLLSRRAEDGLLGGLWELPMLSVRAGVTGGASAWKRMRKQLGLETGEENQLHRLGEIVHVFTHFRQILHVFEVTGGVIHAEREDLRYEEPEKVAVATASRRALALEQEKSRVSKKNARKNKVKVPPKGP
ncbi:MAG: A/G-specific adenine glycosylase [Kiritimatiellia bacterium]